MMLNDERDLLERDVEAVLIERDERHVIVGNSRDLARRDESDDRGNDVDLFSGQLELGQSRGERRCSSCSPMARRLRPSSDLDGHRSSQIDFGRTIAQLDRCEISGCMTDGSRYGMAESGDGHQISSRHRVERHCSEVAGARSQLGSVAFGLFSVEAEFVLQISGDIGFLHRALPTSGNQHYCDDRMGESQGGHGT
jgi:hypothetical protein